MRGEEIHNGHPEQARVPCGSDPYPDAEKYGALRAAIATKDWMGYWRY